MTWPWKEEKTNVSLNKHIPYASNIFCWRRCSIRSIVNFCREKDKRSLVQQNLCIVLFRYWSVGKQRAESRLLHILHLIWSEVAKIDLFIEVNKIIFSPIHLLISLEQHQISKAAELNVFPHIALVQIWAQIVFKKQFFKCVTHLATERHVVVSECSLSPY